MKLTYLVATVIVLSLLAISGCSKSNNPTAPSAPQPRNLIINSSFDSAGRPSLEGWTADTNDTTLVGFSSDVPPGGGAYSVYLKTTEIMTAVTLPAGTHHYRLSAWAKVIFPSGSSSTYGGAMTLLYPGSPPGDGKSYLFSSSVWTYGSFLDTLTLSQDTPLHIYLVCGVQSVDHVLFNLCTFEVLD